MNDIPEISFRIVTAKRLGDWLADIQALLAVYDLTVDENITHFVLGLRNRQLVACAGLDQNIIKCVAIDPAMRNAQISLPLIQEVVQLAADKGYYHLFLYTKPENQDFFKGCGFYPIMTVPDKALLMENTPVGIGHYCQELAQAKQPGARIGAIVLNANPFTLGHRYLVEEAARACDWLHVFVVKEDLSTFKYIDRLRLVRQGIEGIRKVSVHEGSPYMISKATFPTYFIKEKEEVGSVSTAMDLLIFRDYIAPALDITHRYVGTEPCCQVTKQYNEDMKYWLQDAQVSKHPSIEVVEVERRRLNGSELGSELISASAVRRALSEGDFALAKSMVPATTWDFLKQQYT
jgi:[citrate (pro-3S)-lyase] ligase